MSVRTAFLLMTAVAPAICERSAATTITSRAERCSAAGASTTGSLRASNLLWPECHDFSTGGGWIVVEDEHASFGFNAGFHDGEPQPVIEFDCIDHGTGMHMKATSITEYCLGATPTARHMEGSCEIDEVPGFTYMIDIEDNGEPGQDVDFLSITLSDGYEASGRLSGGNIQVHGDCD